MLTQCAQSIITFPVFPPSGDDCALSVVSAVTGAVTRRLECPSKARIKDIAVLFNGKSNSLVATVTSEGQLDFWDLADENQGPSGTDTVLSLCF